MFTDWLCDSIVLRQSIKLTSRNSDGSTIDFLRLEGLLRMAVALDGDKFAHPASARMIALAIQNEVDRFSRLRTNE